MPLNPALPEVIRMRGMSWYCTTITRARKKNGLVEIEDNLLSPTLRSYATSSDQVKIFIIVMAGKQHMGRRHIQAFPFSMASNAFARSQTRCLRSPRPSVPRTASSELWERVSPHSCPIFHVWPCWNPELLWGATDGMEGEGAGIRYEKLNWKDLNYN